MTLTTAIYAIHSESRKVDATTPRTTTPSDADVSGLYTFCSQLSNGSPSHYIPVSTINCWWMWKCLSRQPRDQKKGGACPTSISIIEKKKRLPMSWYNRVACWLCIHIISHIATRLSCEQSIRFALKIERRGRSVAHAVSRAILISLKQENFDHAYSLDRVNRVYIENQFRLYIHLPFEL